MCARRDPPNSDTKEPIKEPHHAQEPYKRVVDKIPTNERFGNVTRYVLIKWAQTYGDSQQNGT